MITALDSRLDPALLSKFDGVRVPRYTSYPTSLQFQPAVGEATYREWLSELAPSNVASLYVHVPFCQAMCWYCGCHTKVVARYEPIAAYLARVRREVALVARSIPGRLKVRHIHFGGGTPTMAAPEDLEAMIALFRELFDVAADAEIAVEIDPRTLSEAMTVALGRAGVNRASLGVQDFDEKVQDAVNRKQPPAMTQTALDWLRAAGITRINLDLMYGLPHQSVASVTRSAEIALAMDPDRLAVFGYAHVPWMKVHQKRIDVTALADSQGRWEQFAAIGAVLTGHGYHPIGLDHFAKADDELAVTQAAGRLSRNFQGYTTDDGDVLLGFGASSIGALPQGYVQNAVAFEQYAEAIDGGRPATLKGLTLSAEDRLRRAVIERLMCDLEVDVAAMALRFGRAADTFDAELAGMADLVADQVVGIEGRRVRVPEAARPLMRLVAARFDTHLAAAVADGTARHSKAI